MNDKALIEIFQRAQDTHHFEFMPDTSTDDEFRAGIRAVAEAAFDEGYDIGTYNTMNNLPYEGPETDSPNPYEKRKSLNSGKEANRG